MQFKERFSVRFLLAAGLCLTALTALAALRFVPFNNDISVMLPDEPEIRETFQFFREAPFARNVLVSFELKEGGTRLSDVLNAVDRFSGKIDSPMITRIVKGIDPKQSFGDMLEFTRLAPQLLEENQLKELERKLGAEFVNKKLENFYRVSLTPAGAFALPLLRQDPLSLQDDALRTLRQLAASSDYEVQLHEGYLISRDGRHALVVLETEVPVTDGFGARKLMNYLDGLLLDLPENVSADVIAGHLHSISNEKVIKQDILVTTAITSVVFIFLFIFLFKDPRALLLFVTPSISVLISIPVCAFIAGKLSYIIMGMGAVISGIAVDYCIHVYVAMQSGQPRKDALREIAKPVISGALTTAGVFAVFLFSAVPGNRQLALFTIVSTFISLGLALLIFPHFLTRPSAVKSAKAKPSFRFPRVSDRVIIGVWICALAACAAAVPSVHFRMDVRQYDGSEEAIFKAEDKFHSVWGKKGRSAMLVVEEATFDKALEKSNRIRPEISAVLGTDNSYASLSSIWAGESTRRERLERWNAFWDGGRREKLRTLFETQGAAYGFSQYAFDPFFKALDLDVNELTAFEEIPLLRQLKQRFAFETENGYKLVSFFTDDEKTVGILSEKSRKWPGVLVVSAKRFETLLSRSTLSEALYLSFAIALILPLLSFLFLKEARLVLISLIPVFSSVLFILGMLAILKRPLNVSNIIALLVVGGFSIDYGTFMIHKIRHNLVTNTYLAVTMSALTIFLGAGALIFARHPVLFSYGSTMVLGIVAGYASAVFVVPAFCRIGKQNSVSSGLLQPV